MKLVKNSFLSTEVDDLRAKLQFLIDVMHGNEGDMLPEGCFTFPDGETWWATGKEPK